MLSGRRYDLLLTANQTVDNYWITGAGQVHRCSMRNET